MALSDIVKPLSSLFDNAVETATNAGKAVHDAINTVTSPETKAQGEAKQKAQADFEYKVIQYPSDLAEGGRHPYWMTFYINKQELSHYDRGSSAGAFDKKTGRAIRSTAQINAGVTRTAAKNIGGTNVGFGRKTQRTTTAIRLFIPDTLSWSFQNSFRDASISGIAGMGVAQAAGNIPAVTSWAKSQAENFSKGGIMGLLASLNQPKLRGTIGPLAEVVGDLIPGVGADLAASALGIAVNPQVDVIYQSPNLRQFTFDFLFAPRDLRESIAVSQIIEEFKFHSAPEVLGQGNSLGRYFVPPSEFDIEFSVDTMGKISTCVLENITIDYAPQGAAFYHLDDRPVNTRMTLQFKELEFITKELVRKGF